MQTAKQLRLNRHTIDRYYRIFRKRLAKYQEQNLKKLSGRIEIDELYFGSKHFGDKRGRGATWRISVIGLLKRNGKVFIRIIPNASRASIMPIISQLVVKKSRSNIYTDKWCSYDGLMLSGYKHCRINYSKEFVRNYNHINGIESFWSYAKRKMRKHNGIRGDQFYLYLKEA